MTRNNPFVGLNEITAAYSEAFDTQEAPSFTSLHATKEGTHTPICDLQVPYAGALHKEGRRHTRGAPCLRKFVCLVSVRHLQCACAS